MIGAACQNRRAFTIILPSCASLLVPQIHPFTTKSGRLWREREIRRGLSSYNPFLSIKHGVCACVREGKSCPVRVGRLFLIRTDEPPPSRALLKEVLILSLTFDRHLSSFPRVFLALPPYLVVSVTHHALPLPPHCGPRLCLDRRRLCHPSRQPPC